MDINTLAAWGEFLGGIAVVVSLVYLAGQIRQNSNLLKASVASTTAQLQYGQNEMIAKDSEIAQLFSRGISDRDSLSEVEGLQFDVMLAIQVQAVHQSFEFQESGIGSMASWYWIKGAMGWFTTQPGFKTWWLANQKNYMPVFRDYVDALIREGEAAG
jgi:hypothetical protein